MTASAGAPRSRARRPGGGSAVTTSYVWCGERLCQARVGGNAPTRSYYDEGELVPGSPAQPLYYGPDQIGSVRRVFASATSAPAYGYDPYGNALQGTAPLTDFNYAGMFYNADSGLYLTQYRAYDPVAGRWLSRDPISEATDRTANMYVYANGIPTVYVDPDGRFVPMLWLASAGIGALIGGGIDLAGQLHNGNGNWSCVRWGEVGWAAATGAALSGLGPEGFLLGRGGLKAAEFGYPKIAGLLNSAANRFGWGYNADVEATVLRAVIGSTKFDVPGIALAGRANALRSGVPAGTVSGVSWDYFGN